MAPRIVVLGGGVLGTSVAAHLARRGAPVTLLTDGGLGSGASGRSLSWLNSSGGYSPEYHRLRLLGLQRYREHAPVPWLRFDGALRWDDGDAARSAWERLRSVGYPARWLTRDEVAAGVPGVHAAAVPESGALLTPDEGWVDLPSLVGELAADLVAHGGRVVPGAGRCEVVAAGGRVTGVRTGSGEVAEADVAVLATGAGVPRAAARLGVEIPDATAPALLVRTAPVGTRLRAVLNTPRVSLRPAPSGGLVVDAAWSEREVVARDDGSFEVPRSTVDGLLRAASAVLDGAPALVAESCGVGPKPVPGDGEPVLGLLPGTAGCWVAFTHSGATLGLVVGELLAAEILDGTPSPLLEPFRPDRSGRSAGAFREVSHPPDSPPPIVTDR
jgi:glycine/D-amino acid oxidase-like deaminating enzyme